MLGAIIGQAINILIVGSILSVVLMVSSKLVLKQSIEYGDAFKAALLATFLWVLLSMGADALSVGLPVEILIQVGGGFACWLLALGVIVGLGLVESLLIAAIATALTWGVGYAITALLLMISLSM